MNAALWFRTIAPVQCSVKGGPEQQQRPSTWGLDGNPDSGSNSDFSIQNSGCGAWESVSRQASPDPDAHPNLRTSVLVNSVEDEVG